MFRLGDSQSRGKFSLKLVAYLLGMTTALSAAAGALQISSGSPDGVATRDGSKDALVIGVDEYEKYPNENCVNDARAVNERLKEAGYKTLLLQNPDHESLLTAVNAFTAKVRGEDFESLHVDEGGERSVWLYFAGICIVKNDTYWLAPTDMKVRDNSVDTKYLVNLSEVLTTMAESDASAKIALVDGDFASTDKSEGKSLAVPIPLGNNMVIGFAVGPGRSAKEEGAVDGHGLFTRQLLNTIFEPGVELVDGLHAVWKALPNQRPVLMISANPGFGPVLSPVGVVGPKTGAAEGSSELVLQTTRQVALELLRKGLELAQGNLREGVDGPVYVGQFSTLIPQLESTDEIVTFVGDSVRDLAHLVGLLESVISDVESGTVVGFYCIVKRAGGELLEVRLEIGTEGIDSVDSIGSEQATDIPAEPVP